MAKRKSTMKNIIYELDNDDIEISSDDEVSGPKLTRTEPETDDKVKEVNTESDQNGAEVLSVDSTDDSVCLVDSPKRPINGGKTASNVGESIRSASKSLIVENNFHEETEIVCVTKTNSDCENSTVFDEDIVVDSPSDLCVAGCENRMPLVTVRFNNSKLSSSCREKIKKFMINLIKEHQQHNDTNSDNETDYELDIWPDDLVDVSAEEEKQDIDDNLFFVDTAPGDEHNLAADIPKYSQVSSTICNETEKEKTPPPLFRRGPMCFNCDGAHQLKDCTRPRDNVRIAKMAGQKRNNQTRVGRYHVEDDQKYGHLVPGRISGQLRHALGLKRNELPLFVYRMRLLGYPPGWLEEARISHSGITLFDSTGSATLDPEEEEGEICEAGSKDKYDIKKILDFPGFNVPASSRYSEEAHLYGLPPMSEQDSKIAMLQMLAPNAMKAYKRKKLTFFPSAANSSAQEGQAEMELDSGDEEAVFPSVPPLPDEAPPPLPPPPKQPPPPPEDPPLPPEDSNSKDEENNKGKNENTKQDKNNDSDTIEIIQDSDASEIPLPDDSFITIDEDYESEQVADRSSPSIDDLEKQKQVLLEALHKSDVPNAEANENIVELKDTEEQKTEMQRQDEKLEDIPKDNPVKSPVPKKDASSPTGNDKISEDKNGSNDKGVSVGTPEPKSGKVKTTSYGTPILNIASSYVKLPSDEKFSKDICDVINFDNLPNSTGKYKQISNLLKKVKTEVDRIQDS